MVHCRRWLWGQWAVLTVVWLCSACPVRLHVLAEAFQSTVKHLLKTIKNRNQNGPTLKSGCSLGGSWLAHGRFWLSPGLLGSKTSLGRLLGASWAILEASLTPLGGSWAVNGTKLGRLGTYWKRLGSILVRSSLQYGAKLASIPDKH